jgi:GT2 family glycosyltransferase
MIFYSLPWNTDKDIGTAYNSTLELLPSENDFVCFLDGDAMMTLTFWGRCIEDVLKANPNAECLTAYTNRVWKDSATLQGAGIWQIPAEVNMQVNDIAYHRTFAEKLWKQHGTQIQDVTNMPEDQLLSGVLILMKKRLWREIGPFTTGMLGVDQDLHRRIQARGHRLYLMKGIYVYHWYRNNNPFDFAHLEKRSWTSRNLWSFLRTKRWQVISLLKKIRKGAWKTP